MFARFVRAVLGEYGYEMHKYISPSFYMASKGNQKLMLLHFTDASSVVINGETLKLADPEFKSKLISHLEYTEETISMNRGWVDF